MASDISNDFLSEPLTRHLRTEIPRLHVDQTVGEALQAIRERSQPDRIIYFYVVDDGDRLQGVVPTRNLLQASLDQSVREIMLPQVIAIPATATVLDACEFFTLHRLLAFPVVDDDGRLLGAVDVELYTKELGEISDHAARGKTDDLFQLIGVHLAEAKQAGAWRSFRVRFPWLLCNLIGGISAAFLAGWFEAELKQLVALALFIPVVLALAESVAIQSVTLALQRMQGIEPTWSRLWSRAKQEVGTGLLLGLACATLLAILAFSWQGEIVVVLSVAGGVVGGVTLAALIGFTLPTLLRLFRRNPQVAAGPIALAVTDVTTLWTYFSLARWLCP